MSKARAAKEGATGLLDYFIRAWHGSPGDFDRFDSQYIGTGEGAQAFGYGHYAADRRGLGEYYRDTLVREKNSAYDMGAALKQSLLDSGLMTPAQMERYGDAVDGFAFEYVNNAGDIDKSIQNLRRYSRQMASDDLELQDMGLFVADKLDALNAKGNAFPQINKGKLYEVGIKASPDEMLDWDKPLSQQSDIVKANLLRLAETTPKLFDEDNLRVLSGTQSTSGFRSGWGDMSGQDLYKRLSEASNRYPGTDFGDPRSPAAAAQQLSNVGIRGVKYLDAASRNAGEGSNNYVVFSDDDIDILNKYLRPETAAIGLTQALTNQDILDLNQQVAIDSGMAQLGYDKNRPESAMYNYSGLLPIKRHKDARGLTDGWLYGYEPAMTGLVEEIARGLLDVGESRKTGRVQNPNSIWEVLF